MTLRYAHLAPAQTFQAVQRLCREDSATCAGAPGTSTSDGNDAKILVVETSP
jgi:hypothetical protein